MAIRIARVSDDGLKPLGTIDEEKGTFEYAPEYLSDSSARPVSCSLPLQKTPFDAYRTACYFEGLLPEGATRTRAARDLGVSPGRYLGLLARLGNDCVADLFIGSDLSAYSPKYVPVPYGVVMETASNAEVSAASNGAMRLSLAGNQTKTGFAHDPECPLCDGWYRPQGGAASTHIMKSEGELSVVPSLEYLSMNVARLCGIWAARTDLAMIGNTGILVSERFDREAWHDAAGVLRVRRLHQEDFAQALGVSAVGEDKYLELPGGSFHTIAEFLYGRSTQPVLDIGQLASLAFYNYLIGNCDAHLKNWSILYSEDWSSLSLAPAYDLVSTVRFEKYSRDLAMAMGGVRTIDDVDAGALERFCADIALPVAAGRKAAARLLERFDSALLECAAQAQTERESIEYEADSLREECAPRLLVLEEFAHRP